MGNVWRAFRRESLPNNYFRIEVIILRWLGIELLRKETLLYSVFSKIFLFLLVVVFTASEAYEIYANWGDVQLLMAVLNYLITHLTGAIKTTLLFKNRKKIGTILKLLHEAPFKPDRIRGGLEEEHLIRRVIKQTEIQLVVYFLVVLGTILSGATNVTIGRFTKDPESWIFPYVPTMSFADMSRSPLYELGCLYQFLSVLLYAGIIATTYILLSAIMAHISVQMEIVGNTFRNLRPRAETMDQMHGDPEKSIDFYLKVSMKDSIEHHLGVLELAKEMERLCSMMILAIFMASVVLLCFLLYFSSLFPVASMMFFQNSCYYCIIVCQVGMYCYWGNKVSLKAEGVAVAAAQADWPGAPNSVCKAIVMVISSAQKPLFISAGGFVPVNMEMFMNIIKGSVSYFTVLKQTQE